MKKNTRSLIEVKTSIENESKSILDTCIDGVISINAKSIIIYINPAAEKISGYTAQEIIGKKITVIYPPQLKDKHHKYVSDHKKTGKRKVSRTGKEVQLYRKDKSKITTLLTLSESGEGESKIFTGFLKDISGEKAIHIKLEEKRTELSAINEGIIDGYLINKFSNPKDASNVEFETLIINSATTEITGYTIDELNEQKNDVLFDKRNLNYFEEQLILLKKGNSSFNRTINIISKKGERKWVDIKSQKITFQKAPAFICFLRDVTEKTIDLKEKEDSILRLNNAQILGKNASWAWDIITGEVKLSDNFYKLWSIPKQTPTFDLFINGIHPNDRSKVKNAIDKALRNEKLYNISYRVISSDAKIKIIEANGIVNFNANKEPIFMFGTVRDITDIYASEKKNETLAALIENSRDFIAYATPDNNVEFVNKSGRKMLGVAPDGDIKKYKISDFLSKKGAIFSTKVEMPSIKNYGSWQGESELKNVKTGEVIPVTKNSFLIKKDGEQEVLGFGTIQRDISRRKLIEKNLFDKEKIIEEQLVELEHNYNSIPIGICLVDLDLKYVRVNEIMASMNGKTVEEHIGKSIVEILPSESAKKAIAVHAKIINNKEPILNLRFKSVSTIKNSNIKFDILASYFPYFNSDGIIEGVTGIVQDVTELAKVENELIKSKSLIKDQLTELEYNYKTLPVGICLLDDKLRFVRINDILANVNGVAVEDHIGKSLKEILKPTAHYVIDLCNKVLESGEPIIGFKSEETDKANPSHKTYWSVNYYPKFSDKQKIVGVTVIAQEITAIRNTQKALEESELKYLNIFKNSEDSIFTIDRKGIIIDLNHGPKRSKIEDFIGSSIINLLQTKEDKKIAKSAISEVFKTKKSVNYETSYLYKDKLSYYSTTLSPILVKGKITNAIAIARNITKHKEAQKEVRKLASIIQSSKDFIGIADIDGKAQLLNKAGKKLVGIGSDKILRSTSILDYFDEATKLRMKNDIIPLVLKKGRWNGEIEFQHRKTKALIPVNFDLFVIKDIDNKQTTHLGTISRDVSDYEKARVRVVQSEKNLREAQKIGKVGSWQLDMANNKLHWSEEIYRLLELEVNSIDPTYETFLSYIHPEDLIKVNDAFYNHIHHQEEYDIVHRLKLKNGTIKYVRERCETQWDKNGNALISIGTASDITQQKLIEIELEEYKINLEHLVDERTIQLEKANTKLSESTKELKNTYNQLVDNESKYRFLAENTHDVVLAFDAKLKRTYVSPSIKKLTGFTIYETFKMSMEESIYPAHVDYFLDLLKKASRNKKKELIYRLKRLTKNNGYIWIETAVSFVYNKKKLEGIITSNRDITKEIVAKNELKNAQTKLVASDKLASLGLLTAGVAHEINNPVNFISAGINALEENLMEISAILSAYEQLDPTNIEVNLNEIKKLKTDIQFDRLMVYISKSIKSIKKGAERTSEIVKGLQSFSRNEGSNMQPTNVQEALNNTLLLLRNQYTDNIDIIKKYGKPALVNCFPGKLNQVFLNIIVNAIQSIKGKGVITLEIKKRKRNKKNYLEVSIVDTGAGMSEKLKSRIFEPFYTTKEVGEGTGLGLSISHGIIKDHGGFIEVESKVGKGTKFSIYLPI